jgi:hypothetical protein
MVIEDANSQLEMLIKGEGFMTVLRNPQGTPRFLSIPHVPPEALSHFGTAPHRLSYLLLSTMPSLTIKGFQGEH